MKLALKQNFVATMFTLGCFAMTMHADSVRKLDGSPTIVLVRPAGRGKTTGLKIAMACAGIVIIYFNGPAIGNDKNKLNILIKCIVSVFRNP